MKVVENYKSAIENSDENLLKELFAPQVLLEVPAGPTVNHSANTASYIMSQVAKTAPGIKCTLMAITGNSWYFLAFEGRLEGQKFQAKYWSPDYIQHSAHIEPGRNGLFNLIRNTPDTLRYEHQLIVAEDDYVIVHGRFPGYYGRPVNWIAADILRIENGRLAEHWDVLQDEATKAESKSGLPMFGDKFGE